MNLPVSTLVTQAQVRIYRRLLVSLILVDALLSWAVDWLLRNVFQRASLTFSNYGWLEVRLRWHSKVAVRLLSTSELDGSLWMPRFEHSQTVEKTASILILGVGWFPLWKWRVQIDRISFQRFHFLTGLIAGLFVNCSVHPHEIFLLKPRHGHWYFLIELGILLDETGLELSELLVFAMTFSCVDN